MIFSIHIGYFRYFQKCTYREGRTVKLSNIQYLTHQQLCDLKCFRKRNENMQVIKECCNCENTVIVNMIS